MFNLFLSAFCALYQSVYDRARTPHQSLIAKAAKNFKFAIRETFILFSFLVAFYQKLTNSAIIFISDNCIRDCCVSGKIIPALSRLQQFLITGICIDKLLNIYF